MGRLTTHVLDTAQGRPGAGIEVSVYRIDDGRSRLASVFTNADGRTDRPLLDGQRIQPGVYELSFHAGDYLRRAGTALADPPFLDVVVVRIGIADPEGQYHVPLLLSPYGYSTYRGT